MQQIFGGTTYSAANNLYQPNYRIANVTVQAPVIDVPSYTKILSATSFQSDPPPSFASTAPVLSGESSVQPASHDASDIDTYFLLPPGFLVDWHKIQPLITVPELKQYLKLLGAFANLLQHVRERSAVNGTEGGICKAFFATAASEFDVWASGQMTSSASTRPAMKPEDLPSLEVLMAWHAYMINPRWYFEDGIRLGSLGAFPLSIIVNDETLEYLPPSHATAQTSSDPPHTTSVTKLARDLVAVANGSMHFLTGTGLLPSTGVWKGEEGAQISKAFVAAIIGPDATTILANPDAVAIVCDRLNGDLGNAFSAPLLADVRARCRKLMNVERSQLEQRIDRMKCGYRQEGSTSVDLAEEIRKQSSLLLKLGSLGWLKAGRFDGDVGKLFPLQKAAIRYHAFLHCMSQMQGETACPTLDIEVAWQLHQLKGQRYVADNERLFKGRLLEQVGVGNRDAGLHAAYGPTARTWLKLYRIPYSVCGCYGDVDSSQDRQRQPSLKASIKMRMTRKNDRRAEDPDAQAYLASISVNEKMASHPSHLDFLHPV